uniref:Uncharacterized protein n=1 Tax=Fagus sylvatica TaxID=28930 RepID=A0A2N9GP98_FAGSY
MALKHHFFLLSWRGARGSEGRHSQSKIRPRKEGGWFSTPPTGPRRITQQSTASSGKEQSAAAAPAAADDKEDDTSWLFPLSTGHGGPQHKAVHGSTSWDKMIIKAKKDLRNLPWPPPLKDNDHHSPALRWSLLLHIMELRKQDTNAIINRAEKKEKGLVFADQKSLDWNFSIRADFKSSRNTKPTAVHGTLPVVNGSLPTPKSPKFYDYYISLICCYFLQAIEEVKCIMFSLLVHGTNS